jgi:hypothetical protein
MDNERTPEEEEILKLEQDIEILRVRYEQYFMGIERLQPVVLRGKVNKAILKSKLATARRAAIRFRFTRLVQKFRTYESMWDRILREIESGKRKRGGVQDDSGKKQFRYLHPELTGSSERDRELMKRVQDGQTGADDDVSLLYKDFVEARRHLGMDTTMDESTFRRKVETLRKKTEKLSVQVRNGRVVLVGKKKTQEK